MAYKRTDPLGRRTGASSDETERLGGLLYGHSEILHERSGKLIGSLSTRGASRVNFILNTRRPLAVVNGVSIAPFESRLYVPPIWRHFPLWFLLCIPHCSIRRFKYNNQNNLSTCRHHTIDRAGRPPRPYGLKSSDNHLIVSKFGQGPIRGSTSKHSTDLQTGPDIWVQKFLILYADTSSRAEPNFGTTTYHLSVQSLVAFAEVTETLRHTDRRVRVIVTVRHDHEVIVSSSHGRKVRLCI